MLLYVLWHRLQAICTCLPRIRHLGFRTRLCRCGFAFGFREFVQFHLVRIIELPLVVNEFGGTYASALMFFSEF